MSRRFYNCHAHCFTYDHVPEYFLSRWLAVSWLLKRKWLKKIIRLAPVTGNFGWFGNIALFFLFFLFGFDKRKAVRALNFIKYGDVEDQSEVIEKMRAYYPSSTGITFLTMDMEFMGAGKPKKDFEEQVEELEMLKLRAVYKNTIYPFIFCDPRRIRPEKKRELEVLTDFKGQAFIQKMETLLEERSFQGIKLYPALGYYPFDPRMKPVYDFALKNCVPLLTHCTIGAVHFKYKLSSEERIHPVLSRIGLQNDPLRFRKAKDFQSWYTHPLNFECLLNKELLKYYWVGDAPDYSKLKICIGHWGNGDDWHNYLDNAWVETGKRMLDEKWPSLDLRNWKLDKKGDAANFSWFTIICDLMRKYPNVYADISYTLNDESLLPLLKMTLEADETIRRKVLFGTDFYMVSKAICERHYAINVRAALGNELFEQIAIKNAERFLNNNFGNVQFPAMTQNDRIIIESGICNDVAVME
jgi:predicted TIM-barrel fold metal-dependent hydrolase